MKEEKKSSEVKDETQVLPFLMPTGKEKPDDRTRLLPPIQQETMANPVIWPPDAPPHKPARRRRRPRKGLLVGLFCLGFCLSAALGYWAFSTAQDHFATSQSLQQQAALMASQQQEMAGKQEALRGERQALESEERDLEAKKSALEQEAERVDGHRAGLTQQTPSNFLAQILDKLTGKAQERQADVQRDEAELAEMRAGIASLQAAIENSKQALDQIDQEMATANNLANEAQKAKSMAEDAYQSHQSMIDTGLAYLKLGTEKILALWNTAGQ